MTDFALPNQQPLARTTPAWRYKSIDPEHVVRIVGIASNQICPTELNMLSNEDIPRDSTTELQLHTLHENDNIKPRPDWHCGTYMQSESDRQS